MAILKVARLGHPVLRAPARPLATAEIASPRVQRLIDDMFETMSEYAGIGLAGPQVHESLRIFVAGVREADLPPALDDEADMPRVALINPEITVRGPETGEDWEGCLSVPDIRGRVVRPKTIDLKAVRSNGYSFQIELTHKIWMSGMRIREVPIIFTDRFQGSSKMSRHIVREALWMVWRLWLQSGLRRSPPTRPGPTR